MTKTVHSNKKTRDPVCGMMVGGDVSTYKTEYNNRNYFFCSQVCLNAFLKTPDKVLKVKAGKEKGWFGRFLDRLAESNEEEFGPKGPQCCH
ncbi:YHS domain-containing protein [Thermodesulfobacteriota bacterium]